MEYIYIIHNPAFAGCYKVGKCTDFKKRMSGYQTGDPFRRYEYIYLAMVEDGRVIEDDVAAHFEDFLAIPGHEWYKATRNNTEPKKALLKSLVERIETSYGFVRSIINEI